MIGDNRLKAKRDLIQLILDYFTIFFAFSVKFSPHHKKKKN